MKHKEIKLYTEEQLKELVSDDSILEISKYTGYTGKSKTAISRQTLYNFIKWENVTTKLLHKLNEYYNR